MTALAPSSATWLKLAACRGKPTRWWFDGEDLSQRVAVAVCRRCPVRARCLAEALTEEAGRPLALRSGVRGGMTPAERTSRTDLHLSGSAVDASATSGV